MSEHTDIFCDYITVSQTHEQPHKPFHGDVVWRETSEGEVERFVLPRDIRGKYDSYMRLKSDGKRVQLKGNIGAFNRPENVFGVDLDICKKLANDLLEANDLPPFSGGEVVYLDTEKNKKQKKVYTGAIFSRIDMTTMLETGSGYKRDKYLQWLMTQTHKTLKLKHIVGSTVYFGKGADGKRSETRIFRIYDKAKELLERRLRGKKGEEKEYLIRLIKHLENTGALRYEMEYHRYLRKNDVRYWDNANHETLSKMFQREVEDMTRKITVEDLEDLPPKLLGTVAMYLQGIDVKKKLSHQTYYRHKAELRKLGFDIANKNNIEKIKAKPVDITLVQLEKKSVPERASLHSV